MIQVLLDAFDTLNQCIIACNITIAGFTINLPILIAATMVCGVLYTLLGTDQYDDD